jgi:hypothetical protein
MTKGAAFVKKYQAAQERKVFEYALHRACFYAKLNNCPLEASLIYRENKDVVFQIEAMKFSKVFKYMVLGKSKLIFYFYPHEVINLKDLNVSFFEKI